MINFDGFKKLDEDLSKIFYPNKHKEQTKENIFVKPKKHKEKQEKLLSEQNVKTIKETSKIIKSIILYIKKLTTPKPVTQQIEETLEQEKKLMQEQVDKAEIERTKLHIKQLKYQEKRFKKKERSYLLQKIRMALHLE